MEYKNPTKDVSNFLRKCSEIVSKYEYDSFGISRYQEISGDLGVDSPIEQYFYLAFMALCQTNNLIHETGRSILIQPQVKLDKYRVDFLVSLINWEKTETLKKCVVECDGHEFHDKDEPQRRYEKQRDRFLQSQGFRVFHFTGSEIKQEPFNCAAEILAFIMNANTEDLIDCNYYLTEDV